MSYDSQFVWTGRVNGTAIGSAYIASFYRHACNVSMHVDACSLIFPGSISGKFRIVCLL